MNNLNRRIGKLEFEIDKIEIEANWHSEHSNFDNFTNEELTELVQLLDIPKKLGKAALTEKQWRRLAYFNNLLIFENKSNQKEIMKVIKKIEG